MSLGVLHANDNCILIDDEQDEVHTFIAYVLCDVSNVGFVFRVRDPTAKFLGLG